MVYLNKLRERPAYGWFVLTTFTVNYSILVIGFTTIGLLLPDISAELDLSPSEQGWLASALLFANLFFEIPINWLLSRYRPWRVATMAFFAAALMVLLQGLSPTYALLIIARIGLGIFYLSTQPPRTLIILQWLPQKQIGLANGVLFGLMGLIEGLGFIAIPVMLLWLGDWRNTLVAWAIVGGVGTLIWAVVGRDRASYKFVDALKPRERPPLSTLFKYKEPWILGIGLSGFAAGKMAYDAFFPTFTLSEYGTEITTAGLVIAICSMASMPSALGLTAHSFFSHNPSMVFIAAGIGMTTSYIGTLFTGYTPFLFICAVINGLSFGFFPLLLATTYRLRGIKPRELAIAVGILYTLMWVGGAIGPAVTGLLQETTGNLRLALFITSLSPLLITLSGMLLIGNQAIRTTPESVNT